MKIKFITYRAAILLRIERSQLRWFSHVSRMPQERLPKQFLLPKEKGKRLVGPEMEPVRIFSTRPDR